MTTLSLLIGLLGLCLATWMIPYSFWLATIFVRKLRTRANFEENNYRAVQKVSVLVPVHNEESVLGLTLESIEDAIHQLAESKPEIDVEVVVCLDNCSDSSALIACGFNVNCFSSRRPPGKWNTLKSLTEKAVGSDWVILCDSGSIWSTDFLVRLVARMNDTDLVGIAPSYASQSEGLLSRFIWKAEAHLKQIENSLGGPISVHGACVAYRTSAFFEAMNILWEVDWQNDDVVIPLVIRARNADRKILYMPELAVKDAGDSQDSQVGRSFVRRRRLARGNSEWISRILPQLVFRTPLVFVVSLRRVFRLLWAYWLTLIVFGISFSLGLGFQLILLGFGLGGVLWFTPGLKRKMLAFLSAALASLESPLWIFGLSSGIFGLSSRRAQWA